MYGFSGSIVLTLLECPPTEAQHLVRRRVRVLSAIPLELRRRVVQQPTISLWLGASTLNAIDIEHPIELAEHQAENACWDTERRAEHDADVSHRHLVDGCILHDEDQMCGQCTQETVVGQRQRGDEVRQLTDAFLCVRDVWIKYTVSI
jgi:hypothetical protein